MELLREHVDITHLSAYKTPASARYFFEVKNEEDAGKLHQISIYAKQANLRVFLLGSGTNCLFDFKEYAGIVIHIATKGVSYRNGILEVGAGELVHSVSVTVSEEFGSSALIPWVGLPGTFGGAIAGNAGCFGLETKDILIDATVYDISSGEITTLQNADFEYSYRNSRFKAMHTICILSARFDLTRENPENPYLQETPKGMQEIRRSKQPPGISCGSVFKNPPGSSAGALIDQCGLKGTSIGRVRISEKHGNFFLAEVGVTAKDVLDLITLTTEKVLEQSGITLETEVQIIKNS